MPLPHAPHPHRPTSRRKFLVAAIIATAVLAAACGGGTDDNVIRLSQQSPDLAPAVEDIQTDGAAGSEVNLDFHDFDGAVQNFTAYAGTPLVINFFARSCPACVSEMPEFQEVFAGFGGDVAFVGISTDPRLEDAQVLVADTGVQYDLGWDPNGDLFANFGGFAMPTTVFVTPDGVVNEVWSGVLTPGDLTAKIESLT